MDKDKELGNKIKNGGKRVRDSNITILTNTDWSIMTQVPFFISFDLMEGGIKFHIISVPKCR